jgi:hypothetical protein
MVRMFSGNRAGVLLLLPIVVILYHVLNQLSGEHYQQQHISMGLWGELVSMPSFLAKFFAASIILINAIGINLIFNTNEFYDRNTYVSSLLYVVLMSFYNSFYSLDGVLLAHSFLILLIFHLFRLKQNSDGRAIVFNAALFGGLASTFHPPMIIIFPFLLLMIWIIKPLLLREFFLALSGFVIAPIYVSSYYLFKEEQLKWDIFQQISEFYKEQTDFYVTSALFILLILLSSLSIRNKTQKSSVRLKKLVNVLWLLMAIGFFYGFVDLLVFDQIERFSFLMVPLAFFLSFSFTDKKILKPASSLFYVTFVYSLINFFF